MDPESNLRRLDEFMNYTGDGRVLYNQVLSYIRGKLNNMDSADDVMQEVQINVWTKRGLYDPTKKLEAWLYTVVVNKIVDFQRRNKRWAVNRSLDTGIGDIERSTGGFEYLDGEDTNEALVVDHKYLLPLSIIETEEQYRRIRLRVASMDDKERKVIELIYFQGLKPQEVAKVLGVPLGTVKSRKYRAILHLREKVA